MRGPSSKYLLISKQQGLLTVPVQNERAAKRGSGADGFATSANPKLGGVLNKNHEIQSKMARGGKRLKVLKDVQASKERKPILGPSLANETRWGGKVIETTRGNMIMGDMMESLTKL